MLCSSLAGKHFTSLAHCSPGDDLRFVPGVRLHGERGCSDFQQHLRVNSPALILSENSGVSLAKIGGKNGPKLSENLLNLAKKGGFRFTVEALRIYTY